MAAAARGLEHGRDHVDFLAAEMARFTGMRIQAGDQHARPGDAEALDEIAAQYLQRLREPFRA